MALLPNSIIYATTGNSNAPLEEIGGVSLGVTSTTTTSRGSALTKVLTIADSTTEWQPVRRSVPVFATGLSHAFHAMKAYSAGTFAYNQTNWVVRTMCSGINGVANTLIRINGNDSTRARTYVSNSAKGALLTTAWRAGYFRFLKISGQRTPWSTAPTTGDADYVLPTNNGSSAADQSQYETYRSVPGELTYMYGALNPLQDEYSAMYG